MQSPLQFGGEKCWVLFKFWIFFQQKEGKIYIVCEVFFFIIFLELNGVF